MCVARICSNKVFRFAIAGSVGALINLMMIYILVDYFNLNTKVMENVANISALEFSIIFSFIINRNWTWNHRIKGLKYSLLRQFIYFHLAVSLSVIMRVMLFPLLQLTEINYLLNTGVGIFLGALMNYFAFDKLIFVRKIKSVNKD